MKHPARRDKAIENAFAQGLQGPQAEASGSEFARAFSRVHPDGSRTLGLILPSSVLRWNLGNSARGSHVITSGQRLLQTRALLVEVGGEYGQGGAGRGIELE